MKKSILTFALVVIATLLNAKTAHAQSTDKNVTIIEITQTAGEISTQILNLKPGKYQFRVVNKNVNKDLGFVIQKAEDAKGDFMKTAIPNSFTTALIKKGEAQYTGIVELKEGEYVYSCPLNPTPHYTLSVK
jgi:ABC-type proline/glycine betaine transport system substrate-binding protein